METLSRWGGLGAFCLVSVLYLGAPLVAPPIGVGLLWTVWAGLALGVRRLWRTRWGMPLLPVLAFGVWAFVLVVGEAAFGWTA